MFYYSLDAQTKRNDNKQKASMEITSAFVFASSAPSAAAAATIKKVFIFRETYKEFNVYGSNLKPLVAFDNSIWQIDEIANEIGAEKGAKISRKRLRK